MKYHTKVLTALALEVAALVGVVVYALDGGIASPAADDAVPDEICDMDFQPSVVHVLSADPGPGNQVRRNKPVATIVFTKPVVRARFEHPPRILEKTGTSSEAILPVRRTGQGKAPGAIKLLPGAGVAHDRSSGPGVTDDSRSPDSEGPRGGIPVVITLDLTFHATPPAFLGGPPAVTGWSPLGCGWIPNCSPALPQPAILFWNFSPFEVYEGTAGGSPTRWCHSTTPLEIGQADRATPRTTLRTCLTPTPVRIPPAAVDELQTRVTSAAGKPPARTSGRRTGTTTHAS